MVKPHSSGFTAFLGALSALPALSIDMNLPGVPAIESSFQAAPGRGALTLSFFFMGFALAPILGGPVADRFGRRPVLLGGLFAFSVAAVACAAAPSLAALLLFRAVQGAAAGICVTLPLAIVRDLLEGTEARHRLSQITAVVGVAPLLAPILGSWAIMLSGWRAIYAAQAVTGLVVMSVVILQFAETLPEDRRQRLNLRYLFRNYGRVLGSRAFLGFALVYALGFGCLFAYIAGSPTVLMRSIGLSDQVFSIVFGVTSLSLILGSVVSARLSTAQAPSRRIIAVCLALMVVSAGCALAVAWIGPVRLFTIMPPIAVIVFCFGLLAPTVTHEAIRPLPDIAGAAAGVLRSLQMLVGAGAGALVTLIVDYTRPPLAMACIMVASALGALIIYIALLGWSERDRGP